MSKQVTRTIQRYKYTFVKTDQDQAGNIQIADAKTAILPERIGDRKMKLFIKEHPELEGYMVGKVDTVLETYAMDLDKFLANATLVPTRETKAQAN